MKAFASDLDRTLIFSRRMLNRYPKDITYRPIEFLQERALSFISEKTEEHLQHINRSMYFIPVTTRTFDQYARLTLFQETIIPEFAIINNGATILQMGQPLQEWSNHIQSQLYSCMPYQEVLNKVSHLQLFSKVDRVIETDNTFIFFKMKKDFHGQKDLIELRLLLRGSGWSLASQDEKLYIIPNPVEKWKAVDYLSKKLNIEQIYSAGDSLLDRDMLLNASFALSPKHGDVDIGQSHIYKTSSSGIGASGEITEAVLKKSLLTS